MGRSPCCDKVGLKKGPWTPEEDQKLLTYIEKNGHGSWRALPAKAGLQRCGKSCRLRWTNYLRPDIKRGEFSLQEEQTIMQLHALLGNRWSAIATHLPKRTDNEIKNYWNTHLKKRLAKMGIDPSTHKAKSDALSSADGGHCRSAANLSHMAQWESARLEAEARLVRESKLRSASSSAILHSMAPPASSSSSSSGAAISLPPAPPPPPPSLDALRSWQGSAWPAKPPSAQGEGLDLESPTSTLCFAENPLPLVTAGFAEGGNSAASHQEGGGDLEPEGGGEWKWLAKDKMECFLGFSVELFGGEAAPWMSEPYAPPSGRSWGQFGAGFTGMLPADSGERKASEAGGEEEEEEDEEEDEEGEEDEAGALAAEGDDSKNYWSSILNSVNSSSSSNSPPMFYN